LTPFASYFGVVAGMLALGSWATSNYVGEAASSAASTLQSARASFEQEANFRRIYELVNEETQNLDHTYDLLREVARERGIRRDDDRYDTIKRLEYTRHMDRFVFDEGARARNLVTFAETLAVSEELVQEITNVRDEFDRLFDQRKKASDELRATIPRSNIDTLPAPDWAALEEKFERYRREVEIDMIPNMNNASQQLAQLESKVVAFQREEADRRRALASRVEQAALILYGGSALLALYGKWLDARKPKTPSTGTGVLLG
jgi:hypothetical protein